MNGADADDLGALARRVTGELDELVVTAAEQIAALVPDAPARTIGWLGDSREPVPTAPAWRGLMYSSAHRDGPELMAPRHRVGGVSTAVAHRLLGALEATIATLDLPVSDVTARLLGDAATAGREPTGERFGFVAIDERFTAFGAPTQLAGLRAPQAEPLTVALVHALADAEPVGAFLAVGPGPIPRMAAEHGRRHLAVAVATSAVVLRAAARAGRPVCPDGPEAVTGVALEAVTRVLADRPMPPAWADARSREHRDTYLLPRASALRLRAHEGRFALTEGPDLPAAGPERATAVPGGIVLRTDRPDAPIDLVVEVLAQPPEDPGDQARDWDEVVELSYTAEVGAASVTGADGSVWPEHEFGLAFPWPGPVRVRVHAGSADIIRDHTGVTSGPGDDGERYLLQLWEADPAPTTVYRRADPDRLTLPWIDDVDAPVILRTDFGDPAAWQAVRGALVVPEDPTILLDVVDDERFADLTPEQLLELAGPDWSNRHGTLYVVDHTTLSTPQTPLLVVNLLEPAGDGDDPRGRSFRAPPGSVHSIAVNLSLGNLSFYDFADWAGQDGVLDTEHPTDP